MNRATTNPSIEAGVGAGNELTRDNGTDAPAVHLHAVTYTYAGSEAPALEDVTLDVHPRERLGILGPNGGGKSTLLKLVLGLLEPQRGEIRVFGLAPAQARAAGYIGYVPQRARIEQAFPLSVREAVTLGASWRLSPLRRVPRDRRLIVDRVLRLVGAADYAHRPIGELSGGQAQRAMIARALAARPRLLVLDEPTVGIDAAGQHKFAELLATVHREMGVTILVVSHDLRAIVAGCDRVACLSRRLHSHTAPNGLTPQVLAELFSHDVAGVLGGVHVHAHAADDCGSCGPAHSVVVVEKGRSERGRV
ncbi:MAG: metal ABC transporter ATP-binding protein [Phycisphaerales bacterium]|nr:metal ABC transporter ATP-binding protein [Phycisphaerales bacterium]